MNPKLHLEYYSHLYPDAWKQVDTFRAGRGKDLPFWPEWCFLPLAGAYAIVSGEAARQGLDITDLESGMPLIADVGKIGALAAWRVTQGIYRFDPNVYQAVISTPLTGDLPHNILFNLPEWCVYIETPGMLLSDLPIAGFFAYLEQDAGDGRKELRIVLDATTEFGKIPQLHGSALHLGPWPLKESIRLAAEESERQCKIAGLDIDNDLANPEILAQVSKVYEPFVSLLLYICTINSEIGDGTRQPTKPRPKKTKKGPRLFPPNRVTTWDVGVRMGAVLRKAQETVTPEETGEATPKQRSNPRPHIRRAHWHGYWTGPRDGEQKFILKWVPPILVGGSEEEKPVTIRPVK